MIFFKHKLLYGIINVECYIHNKMVKKQPENRKKRQCLEESSGVLKRRGSIKYERRNYR